MNGVAVDLSFIQRPRGQHSAGISCHVEVSPPRHWLRCSSKNSYPGTYALYPHFTPLGHAHVMDMFRRFDDQEPALHLFIHHRLVEDEGLGDGDDEGGDVVVAYRGVGGGG